jgi:alkylation response protein AidB-like acyl-CoA dehydrogenase
VRTKLDALIDLHRQIGASPTQRQRVAGLEARLRAAFGVQARALQMAEAEDRRFPAWAAMVKVLSTEIRRAVADAACDALAARAIAAGPGGAGMALANRGDAAALWAYELLDSLAGPIYAGTNQILRNVVGELGLGLPR